MSNQDTVFMYFYIIGSIIWLIAGLYYIKKAKTRKEIETAVMGTICCVSPFAALIPLVVILYLVWKIFIWLPTEIIAKIKGIDAEPKWRNKL